MSEKIKIITLFVILVFFVAGAAPSMAENAPEAVPVKVPEQVQEKAPEQEPKQDKDVQTEIETLKEQVKTLMDAAAVRRALTQTDEEKKEKEKDILSAAGRQYTLMKSGKFGFEYQFVYSNYRYDSFTEVNIIEHNSYHNIKNIFIFEYPFLDNLTFGSAIPFVYEYDQVGTDQEKKVNDLGDVRFYANYQPFKTGSKWPSLILNTYVLCPTGRSPYEINPAEDLSTGSGGYSLTFSASASKSIDPVLTYGTLSYKHNFAIEDLDFKTGPYTMDEINRGDTIGLSFGIGFALSYKTSLSMGYSYAYTLKSKRYYKEIEPRVSPASSSSSFNIGTSWRFSNNRRMNISLDMGLSNAGSHSIAFSFPMEFDL